MNLTVNGQEREVADGVTVADLVRELGRDPDRPGVAVARNREVVRRADWADTTLEAGDRVEVLNAVQGG